MNASEANKIANEILEKRANKIVSKILNKIEKEVKRGSLYLVYRITEHDELLTSMIENILEKMDYKVSENYFLGGNRQLEISWE